MEYWTADCFSFRHSPEYEYMNVSQSQGDIATDFVVAACIFSILYVHDLNLSIFQWPFSLPQWLSIL